MNKDLILHDNQNSHDSCNFITGKVQIKLAGTDKVLFEGFNKVTGMGAELLMRSLFYINHSTLGNNNAPVYNTIESIISAANPIGKSDGPCKFTNPYYKLISASSDISSSEMPANPNPFAFDKRALWFAVGTDGTQEGNQFSVKDVHRSNPIANTSYIPFMVKGTSADVLNAAKNGYGLCVSNGLSGSSLKYGFFAKQFSTFPVLKVVDDEEISYSYKNPSQEKLNYGIGQAKTTNPQFYIEMNMKITAEDCREFFTLTNDNNKIINTISILAATPIANNAASGKDIFLPINVRPFTKLNFPSESLVDDSKGLDITYQIYF